MVTKELYRSQPCRMLSLPFWKSKALSLPEFMKIVHQSDFNVSYLKDYTDEEYFRLYHPLSNIKRSIPDWICIHTAKINDINTIVRIINESYSYLSVDKKQMLEYRNACVFDKEMWVIVYDKKTLCPMGCGIADYDDEINEGILEWVQVLPNYRNMGIGTVIVNELLFRLSQKANFATVSGKVIDETYPEKLYRKCGFQGNDVWHILRKKTDCAQTQSCSCV